MLYVKNVPNWERALRIVIGAGVAAAALFALPGTTGWLVAAGAAGAVASGLLGYCPMCALVGRRLDNKPR
jgi:hypothetical protein